MIRLDCYLRMRLLSFTSCLKSLVWTNSFSAMTSLSSWVKLRLSTGSAAYFQWSSWNHSGQVRVQIDLTWYVLSERFWKRIPMFQYQAFDLVVQVHFDEGQDGEEEETFSGQTHNNRADAQALITVKVLTELNTRWKPTVSITFSW